MRRFSLVLLVTLVACGTRTAPAAGQCVEYEPAVARLRGMLVVETRSGPPNYGETPEKDEQVRVIILHLAQPIDICSRPVDPLNATGFADVSKIQVVLPGTAREPEQLIGERVVVAGALFEAISGRHFTKVVLEAQSIRGDSP